MKTLLAKIIQQTEGSNLLMGCTSTNYKTPHVLVTVLLGPCSYVEMVMPEGTFLELKNLVKDNGNECLIFGVEDVDFLMPTTGERLISLCQDIWEDPAEFCGPLVDPWNNFLKYLWVRYPDGKEERLADIVAMTSSCRKRREVTENEINELITHNPEDKVE